MSLKYVFAKVTSALGYHPASLFNEQLRAAIESDSAEAAERIIYNNRDAALSIRSMFEHAVERSMFRAATVIAGMVPSVLVKDYSAGEDSINRSILMQTTIQGNKDQVMFLIGQGADAKAKDDSGDTALHFAAVLGKLDAIAPLVTAGAAVDAANREGITPLMRATHRGTSQVIEKLLEHGAEIDTRDKEGLNATMHAIRNSNIEAAEHLMRKGGVITDLQDPAVARLHVIATNGGRVEYLRLVNMQHDRERNRLDALAGLTAQQICETGTDKSIKIKPIRLKRQAA
ncbi:MAG: ankyrin repeat domain-containing protein [Alphaproteobacteria bacterium]